MQEKIKRSWWQWQANLFMSANMAVMHHRQRMPNAEQGKDCSFIKLVTMATLTLTYGAVCSYTFTILHAAYIRLIK